MCEIQVTKEKFGINSVGFDLDNLPPDQKVIFSDKENNIKIILKWWKKIVLDLNNLSYKKWNLNWSFGISYINFGTIADGVDNISKIVMPKKLEQKFNDAINAKRKKEVSKVRNSTEKILYC